MIIDTERPIRMGDLEIIVGDGSPLSYPNARLALANELNQAWRDYIVDMTGRRVNEIVDASVKIKLGELVSKYFEPVKIFSAGYLRKLGADLQVSKKELVEIVTQIARIDSLYRFCGAELEGNTLTLALGNTDFKEYIGTTSKASIPEQKDFRERLVQAGIDDFNDENYYFSNPLATCAVVVTSDGYVPLGLRSNVVAIYPNTWHTFGGYNKPNPKNEENFQPGKIDLLTQLMNELSGEAGITDADVRERYFLGIARNVVTRGPEALFYVQLDITKSELERRWLTIAPDRFEHRNVTFYRISGLSGFIDQHRGRMVPTGEACLVKYNEHYQAGAFRRVA